MNLLKQLNNRAYGNSIHSSRIDISFAFDKLESQAIELPVDPYDENNVNPPLGASLRDNRLAVCSEKGSVYLYDADSFSLKYQFQPHLNAVFDVRWRPGHENQLMTVSGDQSFALWDLDNPIYESNPFDDDENQRSLLPNYRRIRAHLSSIKCLSFQDENVFTTCSRDGHIHVWDMRKASCDSFIPESTIPDAHLCHSFKPGSSARSSSVKPGSSARSSSVTRNRKGTETVRSKPTSSATAVLFQPNTPFFFSSGANDGLIKLWDIRKLPSNSVVAVKERTKKSLKGPCSNFGPVREFTFPGNKNRLMNQGYSSLELDSKYRIYGACTDSRIYCFDPSICVESENSDSCAILGIFYGHRSNNFTKVKILNDFLISGSLDGNAYLWSINQLMDSCSGGRNHFKPIYSLPHSDEVTSIEGEGNKYDIFTCTDDQKVHKWTLQRKIFPPNLVRDLGSEKIAHAQKYVNDDVEIELDTFHISNLRIKNEDAISTPSPISTLHNYFAPKVQPSSSQSLSQSSSSQIIPNFKSSNSKSPKAGCSKDGSPTKRSGSQIENWPSRGQTPNFEEAKDVKRSTLNTPKSIAPNVKTPKRKLVDESLSTFESSKLPSGSSARKKGRRSQLFNISPTQRKISQFLITKPLAN